MVALVIALVWLILYCFYLKNIVKDCYAQNRMQSQQIQSLQHDLICFARKVGYVHITDQWEKIPDVKK